MTEERKNEIWAMLDAEAQEWIKEQYEEILEDISDYKEQNTDNGFPTMENRAIGQKQMLIRLFGKRNLTIQAEQNEDSVSTNAQNCENFTKNNVSSKNLADLTSPAIDFTQYRMELTKELAVASIMSHEEIGISSIAERAVSRANEIIKLLIESEATNNG